MNERYEAALYHYSKQIGRNIETEHVLKHSEELVYCFENNKHFVDFDFWTQYETLLGEKISFSEYIAIDAQFDGDPNEVSPENKELVAQFRNTLDAFRKEPANKPEWIITDDDCLQCCCPIPGSDNMKYSLIQINSYDGISDGTPFFQVAHGIIDLEDYSEEEVEDALHTYDYEKGPYVDKQLLAEMFFELENQEFVQREFKTWNEAVSYVASHTGMDLNEYKDPEFILRISKEGEKERLTIMATADLPVMKEDSFIIRQTEVFPEPQPKNAVKILGAFIKTYAETYPEGIVVTPEAKKLALKLMDPIIEAGISRYNNANTPFRAIEWAQENESYVQDMDIVLSSFGLLSAEYIRSSITQGAVAISCCGRPVCQYGDEIYLKTKSGKLTNGFREVEGEHYGPVIGGWGSITPLEMFRKSAITQYGDRIVRILQERNEPVKAGPGSLDSMINNAQTRVSSETPHSEQPSRNQSR